MTQSIILRLNIIGARVNKDEIGTLNKGMTKGKDLFVIIVNKLDTP